MTMTTNSTSENLARQIRKGVQSKSNVADILRTRPQAATVVAKALSDDKDLRSGDMRKKLSEQTIQSAALRKLSERIGINKEHAQNIVKLFPDIKLAIQILVSSILSPKSMTDVYLNYRIDGKNIPPGILASIVKLCQETLEKKYNLIEKLPTMIENSLFMEGAYITAIIPESSVDEIINDPLIQRTMSTEQRQACIAKLVTPKNFLNHSKSTGQEKASEGSKIEQQFKDSVVVIDNFECLKYPSMIDSMRKGLTKRALRSLRDADQGKDASSISTTMESLGYHDVFKKVAQRKFRPVEELKRKDDTIRQSIGQPLHMRLPMDSVIPISKPGDTGNHIAYFVLLDENGVPIDRSLIRDEIDSFSTGSQGMGNFNTSQGSASITHKAVKNLMDLTSDHKKEELFDTYRTVLNKEINEKIMNSLAGSNLTAADRNEIYYFMFFRALAQQRTSLVYVPSELINYFAMDYHPNGIGKTLLHDLNVLFSLRAITAFSRIMAYSKMAIDVTKVSVELDPNDPDPEKAIEMIQNEVLRMRQGIFPMGISNVTDVVEWIQRAGLQFEFSNHPGLPDIKLDFSNNSMQHQVPDDALETELRNMTIMGLGLTPEIVDAGFNAEFATTIVNNNILLSKRILLKQMVVEKNIKDYAEKTLSNDYNFRHQLIKILKDGINELQSILTDSEKAFLQRDENEFYNYYIDTLIESIELGLPRPETTNLATLSEAFREYEEALDKALPTIISEEAFPEEISGSMSGNLDSLQRFYKHYLLRQWCVENNYVPEAFSILNQGDEQNGIQLNKILRDHLLNLSVAVGDVFKRLKDIRDAADKDLKDLNVKSSDDGGFIPSTDDDDVDEGGELDNLGLDDDLLGGDEEENVTEEEPIDELPDEEEPDET